jgi:DNA/RNA-binding domain of Phe-tRNA-synthetase-like protein
MTLAAVALAAEVAPHLRLGVLAFDEVRLAQSPPGLESALAEAATAARTASDLGETVTAVRAMYRRFGVDPTKTRPSSEALLRRVRKGEPLPRVNAAVDVCNWCSLETQLPFGLYDLDRIAGDVVLRTGRDAEQYEGIRKDVVHLHGRLTLADQAGPFGNPTSDSSRTMVTPATTRLLVVVFAPRSVPEAVPARALDLTTERVRRFCGGAQRHRAIV